MTNMPPNGPGDQPEYPYGQQGGQPGYPPQGYPQQPPYGYQQGHQPGYQQTGHPYPPQQGGSGKKTGLIIGASALAAVVVIGGVVGVMGLAGAFTDETKQPLSQRQIDQLLVTERDMPFDATADESESFGWLPEDFEAWIENFPEEDGGEELRDQYGVENLDGWDECLEAMTSFQEYDFDEETSGSTLLENDEDHSRVAMGISTLEEAPELESIWNEANATCDGEFDIQVDEYDEDAGWDVTVLEESGFVGTHQESRAGYGSTTLASLDHGDNVVWVIMQDVDLEDAEEILEAQRERLEEGLD